MKKQNSHITNQLTRRYKGYVGDIEFSPDDDLFYGQVQGISSLVSYHAKQKENIQSEFEDAVDAYIAFCEEVGVPPESPSF